MTTTAKKKTTKKDPLELPIKPFAFEVLHLASKQRSKAKKVEVLKRYEDPSLKAIFIWNFDESIISVLPDGEVPYTGYDDQTTYSGTLTTKISEEVRKMHETGSFSIGATDKEGHTTIRREYKNFYHFIKGGDGETPQWKKEQMFVQLLEGLHESEAALLVNAKDKKLHQVYKGLSTNVVCEAFNWNDNFMLMS